MMNGLNLMRVGYIYFRVVRRMQQDSFWEKRNIELTK
jgi:hypothetical protein